MKNYKRAFGDDLKANHPDLKYNWSWSRIASGYNTKELEKWTHFQSSEATIGQWELSVSQWGNPDNITYSASILYVGHTITSSNEFKTRVGAQIAAEKLISDWIKKQSSLIRGRC